eukprot:3851121-Pyramimonas_sp.AAC.2
MGTQLFPPKKLPTHQRNRSGKRGKILQWLAFALFLYTTTNVFFRGTDIDLNAHPADEVVELNVPGKNALAVTPDVKHLSIQRVWVGEHLTPAEMAEQEGMA